MTERAVDVGEALLRLKIDIRGSSSDKVLD